MNSKAAPVAVAAVLLYYFYPRIRTNAYIWSRDNKEQAAIDTKFSNVEGDKMKDRSFIDAIDDILNQPPDQINTGETADLNIGEAEPLPTEDAPAADDETSPVGDNIQTDTIEVDTSVASAIVATGLFGGDDDFDRPTLPKIPKISIPKIPKPKPCVRPTGGALGGRNARNAAACK